MFNLRNFSYQKWLFCAAGIVLLDQLGKLWVLKTFHEGERFALTSFFDLTLTFNTGAAFNFLANAGGWQRWFFVTLAFAISAWIIVWIKREPRTLPKFALTLILGGAIGNVIDRLVHGKVVDFLLVYWRDWYYPAFNLADSAITLGAVLIILDSFLGPKPVERGA